MMDNYEIEAERRHGKGKSESRRLRREGKIPAVLYGAGAEPVAIQLGFNDMMRTTANETFYSSILTLKLDGTPEKVVIKDMQRHAYKPRILHMDFQRIDEAERVTMRIPIHFINEDRCVGVKEGGGILSHLLTEIEITCLPKDLPEFIEINVEHLQVGDAVQLADVTTPDGVTIAALQHGGDGGRPVVSVQVPKIEVEVVEEMEGEEILEGEEGEDAEAKSGESGDDSGSDGIDEGK